MDMDVYHILGWALAIALPVGGWYVTRSARMRNAATPQMTNEDVTPVSCDPGVVPVSVPNS